MKKAFSTTSLPSAREEEQERPIALVINRNSDQGDTAMEVRYDDTTAATILIYPDEEERQGQGKGHTSMVHTDNEERPRQRACDVIMSGFRWIVRKIIETGLRHAWEEVFNMIKE